MTGKVTFKRTAVQTNVDGGRQPSFINLMHVIYDVKPVVERFSQLKVKAGWGLECRNRDIYAISPDQKKEEMMKSILGDESPLSYIQAASCYHLLNTHTDCQYISWDEDAVIDDSYVKTLDHYGFWPFGEIARSMNPLFFYDSLHHPVVVFFTYHREVKDVIVKHIHRFDYEGYGLKYGYRTWAVRNKEQVSMKRIK
ncbi:hypothetical protein [Salimicrobium halophilum]|uniref:Uncharacterized protein n=1 Tax=Salimicrobium halophilum TaxID=86666 RepID=A0A1G8S1J4_9BACI|nr:hypothetical protein [Salimicrobium halophilum]SDJ23066.1 hypothetical protein SAMN04490247_1203 [Salimicrobium halophilum]